MVKECQAQDAVIIHISGRENKLRVSNIDLRIISNGLPLEVVQRGSDPVLGTLSATH